MTDSGPPPSSSPQAQNEHQSVARAAGLIGLATFSSRILGFLRDIVLARLFGASAAADAFFVAYRIPNLLRELFAEGSMSAAFIPIFTEYRTQRTHRDAWELASAAFTTLLTLVTLVTALGILAAPGIVWVMAPGFHDDPDKLETTTLLTRIMFPYLLFISLAALAMGILNSLRAFAAPALSPVFFNVFVIGCALFVAPLLADPIIGVAIGVVAGGAAQFAMQVPGLVFRRMLPGLRWEPRHAGVRRMAVLMLPYLLGLSVTQINLFISTVLASFFDGGPTYLFYGMRLVHFPLGIFGVALATAILPTLSAQAAGGAIEELGKTLAFGLRMIAFMIVPAMLGLILLRVPIVHLFFEHGSFTAADTQGTASALLFFSLGLWAFAGVRIVVAAFYSLQDTKTPALSAACAVVAYVVFSLLFMGPLEHGGLALATSLAAMVNVGILVIVLDKRLGRLAWREISRSLARVALAAVPVVLACLWVAGLAVWGRPDEWAAKAVMLVVGIGLSVTGYFGVHALLRSDELDVAWGILQRKIGGGGEGKR